MPFLDLSAGPVFYREAGAGTPRVVLLHGFGATHRVWDAVQDELADS